VGRAGRGGERGGGRGGVGEEEKMEAVEGGGGEAERRAEHVKGDLKGKRRRRR